MSKETTELEIIKEVKNELSKFKEVIAYIKKATTETEATKKEASQIIKEYRLLKEKLITLISERDDQSELLAKLDKSSVDIEKAILTIEVTKKESTKIIQEYQLLKEQLALTDTTIKFDEIIQLNKE